MRRAMLAFVALLLAGQPVAAQFIEQGDKEVQANALFLTVEGMTLLSLSGIYGYYYTEKLQLGGGPTINYSKFAGWSGSTTVGLTAFGRYYLTARDKLVPYVGGQWYQYDIAPDSPAGFTDYMYLQASGGVKYFLNEFIAYDVSANLGFGVGGGVIFYLVAGVSAIF